MPRSQSDPHLFAPRRDSKLFAQALERAEDQSCETVEHFNDLGIRQTIVELAWFTGRIQHAETREACWSQALETYYQGKPINQDHMHSALKLMRAYIQDESERICERGDSTSDLLEASRAGLELIERTHRQLKLLI